MRFKTYEGVVRKALCMSLSLATVNKMPWHNITHRILEIVARAPGCQIADVAKRLPDVTLREVLDSLCYLKQSGQLEVVEGNQGAVFVSLSPRLFH
jgi:hypothetical protein